MTYLRRMRHWPAVGYRRIFSREMWENTASICRLIIEKEPAGVYIKAYTQLPLLQSPLQYSRSNVISSFVSSPHVFVVIIIRACVYWDSGIHGRPSYPTGPAAQGSQASGAPKHGFWQLKSHFGGISQFNMSDPHCYLTNVHWRVHWYKGLWRSPLRLLPVSLAIIRVHNCVHNN